VERELAPGTPEQGCPGTDRPHDPRATHFGFEVEDRRATSDYRAARLKGRANAGRCVTFAGVRALGRRLRTGPKDFGSVSEQLAGSGKYFGPERSGGRYPSVVMHDGACGTVGMS
jgi:hypothetical protein